MNPLGLAISILLEHFEAVVAQEFNVYDTHMPEEDADCAIGTLKHAIIHLADPTWERHWQSAVWEN
jgi:hypothetical protein